MSLTRRLFLRNTAAAGAVAASVAVAVTAKAKVNLSAKERFDLHLAEFKKAAEELDPRIGSWYVSCAQDEGSCSVVVSAHRVTGRYVGDGIYEKGTENVLGGRTKYQVRLLKVRIDGHRAFDVRTPMDRMLLSEPRLNTFIGKRIGKMEGGAA